MTATSRRWLVVALGLGVIVVAHLLDGWAYRELRLPAAGDRDWGRLLRVLGFAPTWLAIALMLWLEGRAAPPPTGQSLRISAKGLATAVLIGGIASELAKLLIRRERPNVTEGLYQFRDFTVDPFSTSRLGLPSGHTMVAFSGAGALGRRYPRAAPVLFALAAGCGLTRVFAQAHFLSDVVIGAIGGGWLGSVIAGRVADRAKETGT
ncbi:MAG: phosphatase PAP2 family protein [Gemmatimonadales bacterium]